MLPDFPQIKNRVLAALLAQARAMTPGSSLLAQIRHIRHIEGNRFGDELSEEHLYTRAETKITIDRQQLIREGTAFSRNLIATAMADMSNQMEKRFFATIVSAVESIGNEVHSKNGRLTPEDLIALLGKIRMDFDKNGCPIWPTLTVHPDNYRAALDCVQRMTSDEVYRKQLEVLLEKKREEWNSRESSRRLVD